MTEFVFKPEGQLSSGWNANIVSYGWRSKPIFQHRTFAEFFLTNSKQLDSEELYEYVVWGNTEEEGCLGSIIAFIDESDQHVGKCLSVRWALSKNPGVLTQGYRKLIELAKYLEVPFIAVTKEIGPMTYIMKYKKVKLD